jgi:hypothetical protein
MSTPIPNCDGIEDSKLYAPRRGRASGLTDPVTIVDPMASSPLIGGAPPIAPDVAHALWNAAKTSDSPPMAPGIGGHNIDLPPSCSRPFEGDIAVKDLRDRLSRDPRLVPEPPDTPSSRSVLPRMGHWVMVIGLAAGTGIGARLVTLPHESPRESIVGAATPLLDGLAHSEAPMRELPRLVVESRRAFANEPLPLGISVHSGSGEELLTLVGLARGTTLTAGTPLGLTGWQLPARELGKTFAHAPKDFVGFMDAAIDLRSARDRLVDSQFVRLEWLPKQQEMRPPSRAAASRPTGDLPSLPPEEIASLVKRGEDFFKAGDVPSARIALRRAAQAGSARAALSLGATYDPILLVAQGVIGFAPDPVQARTWYARAAELGADEAPGRLERLAGL